VRIGKDGQMPANRSELSSIAQLLEQLTTRITTMAEGAYAEKDESDAVELFAIERTLQGASRRLGRILNARR
jgi:hypothetical protein